MSLMSPINTHGVVAECFFFTFIRAQGSFDSTMDLGWYGSVCIKLLG